MSLNDTTLEGDKDFFTTMTRRENMNPKKPDISLALCCKKKDYTYDTPTQVRTGNWVIHEKRRQGLMGSTVVLTDGQKNPAYLGGRITGINPKSGGRVEVVFEVDRNLTGDTSCVSHPNWGNDKCYM